MSEKTRISMLTIRHPELGLIQLRTLATTRRQTIKVTQNLVIITVPPGFEDRVFPLSAEMVERILQLRTKVVKRNGEGRFRLDEPLETLTFKVQLDFQSNPKVRVFGAQLKDGLLQINMPEATDLDDDAVQRTLKRIVLKFLRMEAERILPAKIEYWSRHCGLSYRSLKIDTAKSRWGCCSSSKEIKLSYYLLLLPERLIDYVIVHELCHTREMNHGPRFKSLLHSYFADYIDIELAKPRYDRSVAWLKE